MYQAARSTLSGRLARWSGRIVPRDLGRGPAHGARRQRLSAEHQLRAGARRRHPGPHRRESAQHPERGAAPGDVQHSDRQHAADHALVLRRREQRIGFGDCNHRSPRPTPARSSTSSTTSIRTRPGCSRRPVARPPRSRRRSGSSPTASTITARPTSRRAPRRSSPRRPASCADRAAVPQSITVTPATATNYPARRRTHAHRHRDADRHRQQPIPNYPITIDVTGAFGRPDAPGTTNAAGQFVVTYTNDFAATPERTPSPRRPPSPCPVGLEFKRPTSRASCSPASR